MPVSNYFDDYTLEEVDAEIARRLAAQGNQSPQEPAEAPEEQPYTLEEIDAEIARREAEPGGAADIARQIGQGALLGWADEIEALARAPFSERSYQQIADEIREANSRYSKANPLSSLGLQVAGGVGTGIGGAIGAGRAIGQQAIQAVPRLARWAAGGTTAGAVEGAGVSLPGSRKGGAVTGGIVGGALGTTLPLLASAFRKGAMPVIQQIRDNLSSDAEAVAVRRIIDAFERDDLTPDQAIARLEELGGPGVGADVGPNVTGLAEAVATQPGKSLEQASTLAAERTAGQTPRLIGKLDEIIPEQKALLPIEESPAFEEILNKPMRLTKEIFSYFDRPSMQSAWRRAQNLAAEGGQELPSIDAVRKLLEDDRNVVEMQTRVMHWLKKGLDDVIEPQRARGKQVGQNKLMAIEKTRRGFRDAVKRDNPEYGRALDRLHVQFRMRDAYNAGNKDFLTRVKDSSQLRGILSGLKTQAEKDEYKRGVRDVLASRMDQLNAEGRSQLRPMQGVLKKIETLFGDEAPAIIQAFDLERQYQKTGSQLTGNSRTAFRQAAQEELDAPEGTSQILRDASYGRPGTALLVALGRQMERLLFGVPGPARDAIGQLLLTPNEQGGARALAEALARAQQNPSVLERLRNSLGGNIPQ